MTQRPRLLAAAAALFASMLVSTLAPAHAGEAEIRKNLAASIPQLKDIDEVRPSQMDGLWEVRVNQRQIFYTDANGKFLVQGNLIDVKGKRNLTEERIDKLSAIDFSALPLKDSFKIVRGNGKRQMAAFEDPNCGYCKQFERELSKVDDVTVHVFLYPVLGPDSIAKSNSIWCAADKGKIWTDWMTKAVPIESKTCDVAALERNLAFGQKHGITGTPTLIFADGTRAPGAIPPDQIEQRLAAAQQATK